MKVAFFGNFDDMKNGDFDKVYERFETGTGINNSAKQT